MPQIKSRRFFECIIFIFDENRNRVGLGAVLEYGDIVLHTKFELNLMLCGFTYPCFDKLVLSVYSVGSYKSVALMKVSYFEE